MVSQPQSNSISHSSSASRSERSTNSHQKKRKGHSGRQAANKNKKLVVEEAQLDRFAGSSEEEADDLDNEEWSDVGDGENRITSSTLNHIVGDESPHRSDDARRGLQAEIDNVGDAYSESEDKDFESDDADEVNNEVSEDEEGAASGIQITSGLANAMSRILSSGTTAPTSTVILSKTKTPLQIQAAKEKKMQESLKESRRLNRERKLKALHIPLTVATSMAVSTAGHNSLAAELEAERTHRRVATRGVVALFNAIAQHQTHPDQTAVAAAESSNQVDPSKPATISKNTKLTKCGFLDIIKKKAAAATSVATSSAMTTESRSNNAITAKKWNALKDDYMLDSSKNWDEVDSD